MKSAFKPSVNWLFAFIPISLALELAHVPPPVLFFSAALAIVPIARLIVLSTEQLATRTGDAIGGLLNATFGNAPELIIALFTVNASLPEVVRGSLAGSVVSNILLVLGAALIFGGGDARHGEPLDRFSLLLQLGLVMVAVLLFLFPSVPGWSGDAERHSLAVVTIPVALALLVLYVGVTMWSLRRHKRLFEESGEEAASGGWSLPASLVVLGIATVVTALISETLVHSLDSFAHSAGISEFFIAAVIVAIVGNAAEHGGAIVIAHRGKLPLATEIAVSSSAQVALLVTPVVALASWLVTPALPLTFRPIELAAMGGAAVLVAITLSDGRGRRWEGFFLVAVYVAVAAAFWVAGDR